MAATPYKGIYTFEGIARTKQGWVRTGRVYQAPFTADDVAGARVDFDQTGTEDFIPPEDVVLTDITVSADGVDTKRQELYVNGNQTTYTWRVGALKDTIQQPHLMPGTYPRIAKGSRVQFYQRA